MNTCYKNHFAVQYESSECPVCNMRTYHLIEITELQEEINLLDNIILDLEDELSKKG